MGTPDERVAVIAEFREQREALRNRAQQAGTLVVAAVAAIIAAGAAGAVAQRPEWVRVLGAIALVTWIATAWLYLRAVVGLRAYRVSAQSASDLAQSLGEAQWKARRDVQLALAATALALVVTAATLLGAFFTNKQTHLTDARLVLTAPGARSLAQACGAQIETVLDARISTAQLDKAYLTVELAKAVCGQDVLVRLRRSDVVVVRTSEH